MPYKTREEKNAYMRGYYTKHPQGFKDRQKTYRKTHPDYFKEKLLKLKLKVFLHYSNGTMKCKYCGESHIECLQIDHINNNGSQERKLFKKLRISISSNGFYYWLIRNNFPEGYQILCANCNIFKRFHPNWKGEKNVPD